MDVLSSRYRKIGINWYLTDDRHGNPNHGKDIKYLEDENWSYHAPAIFSSLKDRVKNNQRNVSFCKLDRVVGIEHEFMDALPAHANRRDYLEVRAG